MLHFERNISFDLLFHVLGFLYKDTHNMSLVQKIYIQCKGDKSICSEILSKSEMNCCQCFQLYKKSSGSKIYFKEKIIYTVPKINFVGRKF